MTTPPPNPFFHRVYSITVGSGKARCMIPAPGGKIARDDADDLLAWLDLIRRQIERARDAGPAEQTEAYVEGVIRK